MLLVFVLSDKTFGANHLLLVVVTAATSVQKSKNQENKNQNYFLLENIPSDEPDRFPSF
jgi:hypothetical protein